MLHRWDGIVQVISSAWFPLDKNKELRFTRTHLFFIVRVIWVYFLLIPIRVSCIFTEEKLEFGHFAIKPRSVDVCPSVSFSHLQISSWSSTRMTISVLITSLTMTLLLRLLSLARRLDLESRLFQSFPVKDYGGEMLL